MKTDTTYNTKDLITSISFGEGQSLQGQLLNDESFKILSGLYGKYQASRQVIESQLKWLFQDFDESYYNTALATLKVGALPLDIMYNQNVTM